MTKVGYYDGFWSMTPESWQQIEAIFHEALELGDGERAKFIRERAGNDSELIAEVEKLLEQFREASSFIEQPLYGNARTGFLSALWMIQTTIQWFFQTVVL